MTNYLNFMKNRFNEHYETVNDVWSADDSLRQTPRQLLELSKIEIKKVLDIGCGRGCDADYFIEKNIAVDGIDLVETQEATNLSKFSEKFNFKMNSFQNFTTTSRYCAILDNGSFHHQDDNAVTPYLEKIFKLLKPEGMVGFSVYTPKNSSNQSAVVNLPDGRIARVFNQNDFIEKVCSKGFQHVKSIRMPHPSGGYYLHSFFIKPTRGRVLLISPLPTTVRSCIESNLSPIILVPQKCVEFYLPLLDEVEQLASEFHRFDLSDNDLAQDFVDKYKNTQLLLGYATCAEPDRLIAETILDQLNLQPNSKKTLLKINDKLAMRQALDQDIKNNIPFRFVKNSSELALASQALKLPLILKPKDSEGSKNIKIIRNIKELSDTKLHYPLLAEKFIEGMQLSIECFTHSKGNHTVLGIIEKFPISPPFFVETGGICPARITASQVNQLTCALSDFLDKTEFKFGYTHTEFFLSNKGVRIIESHSRPGGLVPFLIEATTGVQLESFMFNWISSGNAPTQPKTINYSQLNFIQLEAGKTLKKIHKLENWQNSEEIFFFNIWIKPGQTVPTTINNQTRHGYFVVTGQTPEDVGQRSKELLSMIEVQYES